MITLDHVQSLALRRSASASVDVGGRSGTGKSTLANAIAAEAARNGKTCLLVGDSAVLGFPLGYSVVGDIHGVLAERAQLTHPSSAPQEEPRHRDLLAGPVAARARSNPAAARAALLMLQKAQQILTSHGLTPGEVEASVALSRELSESAINSLSLATQDASRIADMLWAGNARTGRSIKDVDDAVAGRPADVPVNEEALSLILASDQDYERDIARLVSGRHEVREESRASASVASLLRPRSSHKTLSEYHRYASFMARTIGAAVALIKRHGNLKAALGAAGEDEAAKAIGYFMRMRPDQGAPAAVRTFEAALQDYRHDSAVLEPLVQEFGSRTIESFKSAAHSPDGLPSQDIGSLVQKLREARYAARHLPAHLATLRAALSRSLYERVRSGPIEDARTAVTAGSTDHRSKAATELRQLRELFASTGFGDIFEAPPDFAALVENASPAIIETDEPAQSYGAGVLDLLLELTTADESRAAPAWPASVVRARSAQEAVEAYRRHGRFDVVVIDDILNIAEDPRREIERAGALTHRIGLDSDDSIALEIPHRQSDAAVAAAASGQSNRWLGSPTGIGIVVSSDPTLGPEKLPAAAAGLAAKLRQAGFRALVSPASEDADIVVAFADTARNTDLREAAANAREGIVVFCRTSELGEPVPADPRITADIKSAQALGWKIIRTTFEGTVLEKDGRLALFVYEATALSPRDETVANISRRLEGLGWRPIVSWNGAERSVAELEHLLAVQSIAATPASALKIIGEFDPHEPPPTEGPPEDGPRPNANSPPETAAPQAVSPPSEPGPNEGASGQVGADIDGTGSLRVAQAHAAEASENLDTPLDYSSPAAIDEAEAEGESSPVLIDQREDSGPEEDLDDSRSADDAVAAAIEPDDVPKRAKTEAEFAFSGSSTIFKDRRGSRRAAPARDSADPRQERRGTARVRQTEAKLRLVIDRRRKNVQLAGVLSRSDGFPAEIEIAGDSVLALNESRYSDIEMDWTPDLLRGEFRRSDEVRRLEWMRSARRIHLFAALAGEAELISVSAAETGIEYAIVCCDTDAAAIEHAAEAAGSASLRRLAGFEGVPAGWTILESYIPKRAAPGLAEWLKPLDPGAATRIVFSGGMSIRASAYADIEPPRILLEGLPSNCEVFIGGVPAAKEDDGSWTAPGWAEAGKHLIDVVPGPSQSYEIIADPAWGLGWEPWGAHDSLAAPLAGLACVCGAMVFSQGGRTVLATESATSVTALGARHEMQGLALRRDVPASIAALPFEPLFVILSSSGRRNSKILVLNYLAGTSAGKPAKLDSRWIAKVRDVAARRVPVRPQTQAAQAAWRSATREARRWRRTR
ncbi:hypothetical protein [Bradyrhizobium sp. CSS354]|uniref:hypothetical protein n=1 Tax=Bradyrhizobium sp. CSS354 TaxID=2699172 RepID=UPI0023B15B77|nr:hypothetical protein [Bradyrhizobium sp. CSS354]MDE5465953.1 hypothetical protein [Bradyrhizobium sp. CSS354]